MLTELKWRSLALRRVDSRLLMLYKIRHALVNIHGNFIPNRDGLHINPIHARTNYFLNSFFPRTITDFNRLPNEVLASKSLDTFRVKIANIMHHLPY